MLMLNKSSLGRKGGLSQGDTRQLVDAIRGITELGGEVDGVGVVPLGQHADVGVDEGIDVGRAETVGSVGEREWQGWGDASSAGGDIYGCCGGEAQRGSEEREGDDEAHFG